MLGFADQFQCACGNIYFNLLEQDAAGVLQSAQRPMSKRLGMKYKVRELHAERDLAKNLSLARRDRCATLRYCPEWATSLPFFRDTRIARVFLCRKELQALGGVTVKGIRAEALAITDRLRAASMVPLDNFGLTGSVATGRDRQDSDVDIVVYGLENCRRVSSAMTRLVASGDITLPSPAESWHVKYQFRDFFLKCSKASPQAYHKLLLHRMSFKGMMHERKFDLYFIDALCSMPRALEGEKTLLDKCSVEGVVEDDTAAFLLPSSFKLNQLHWKKTLPEHQETGSLTVQSLLNSSRLLRRGDRILVRGTLVGDAGNRSRLVVTDGKRHGIYLLG